jgi:hypothetical protein
VAGDARRLGGERHDKRRGADAGDYPEDDDRNDDAKPTPEEAGESVPIYPCTALAVFKILESFRSSSSAGRGVSPSPTSAVVGAVDGGRRGRRHEGATMTMINRLEDLGLPLAAMLSRMAGVTVYSVDVDSVLRFQPDGRVQRVGASSMSAVERCVGMLTVIVSGVPSASFRIPTEWIPENATVFDIATGRSNFDVGTLLGDDASRRGVTHFSLATFAIPRFVVGWLLCCALLLLLFTFAVPCFPFATFADPRSVVVAAAVAVTIAVAVTLATSATATAVVVIVAFAFAITLIAVACPSPS